MFLCWYFICAACVVCAASQPSLRVAPHTQTNKKLVLFPQAQRYVYACPERGGRGREENKESEKGGGTREAQIEAVFGAVELR